MIRVVVLLLLALYGVAGVPAGAHEVRPAYIELREVAPDTWDALWKVPARDNDERLGLYVRLPVTAQPVGEVRAFATGGAYIERWRFRHPGGIGGQTILIEGLASSRSEVLVRVEHADGTIQSARVQPDTPSFVITAIATSWQVAETYLTLGVEHILGGIDHLLFVFALILLVQGWRRIVATITAFTIAHSLTLAAATLGVLHVPGPPVEACIALSIVLLAAEIVRAQRGQASLTLRAPWLVAFAFGLLHGLGFAGALTETGLPANAVPLALLLFNLGVELGQLLFIAAVLPLLVIWRRLVEDRPMARPAWASLLPSYVIGSIAATWLIERVASF